MYDSRVSFWKLRVLVALCAVLLSGNAPAQTTTGSVTGTVVDSTGAAIPDATVTLTNADTGVARTAVTTATAEFIFVAVVPGTYSVKVAKTGFSTLERSGVTLTSNDRVALGNMELSLGQANQSIQVTAGVAQINTESAEQAGTLSSSQLNDLQIKGRDYMNLAKLLPGVAQTGGYDVIGGVFGTAAPQINGMRNTYDNMTIDGARGNDFGNPSAMTSGVGADQIAEVTVLTSTYLAEVGPNPGGSIKVVTKSGTREFHGSAYFYKRDKSLNANDFFVNRQGLQNAWPYRLSTAGINFGGPVFIPKHFNADRNKLFFYFNDEIDHSVLPAGVGGDPTSEPQILQYTTPTALERTGNFSQSLDTNGHLEIVKDPTTGLPFPGNIIPPTRISSVGQSLLSIFPLPNVTNPALTGYSYNYQFANFNDAPMQTRLLKLDYLPRANDRIMFRPKQYTSDTRSYTGVYTLNGTPLQEYGYYHTHDDIMLSWTHVVSPTIVNELTSNLIGFKECGQATCGSMNSGFNFNYSKAQLATYGIPTTATELYPNANPLGFLPGMTFNGISNPVNFSLQSSGPYQTSTVSTETFDNLSINHGSHAFKFGYYFLKQWSNEGVEANNFNGAFAFDSNQSYLGNTGQPFGTALLGNYYSYAQASTRNVGDAVNALNEFYAQDAWKATKRLTLNYGLRVSVIDWFHLYGSVANNPGAMLALSQYNGAQTPLQYQPGIANGVRVGVNPATGTTVPSYDIGAFVPGTGNPANGAVTRDQINAGNYPAAYANNPPVQWQPRFGFAMDVFGNGKTALRGGIGVGKQALQPASIDKQMSFMPPVLYTSTQYDGNVANLQSQGSLLFASPAYSLDKNLKVPTVYNWSVGVQQTIPWGIVLDAAYVGNHNIHVQSSYNLNALPAGAQFAPQNIDPTTGSALPNTLLTPYREYSTVTYIQNAGTSTYKGLQFQASRRLSTALQVQMSYTLSRAFGVEPATCGAGGAALATACTINQFVPSGQWLGGLEQFNQTNVAVVNFNYRLPRASRLVNNGVVKVVFDNWQLSGIGTFASGFPYTVTETSSTGLNLSGSTIAARINMVPGCDPNSGPKTFADWFNTACFAESAKGTFGNAGPNSFIGPGINNIDLSLTKNVPLGSEKRYLRLRFEAYNSLNHTQFANINTAARFDANGNQINSQFGQATAARPARVIQLNASLYF